LKFHITLWLLNHGNSLQIPFRCLNDLNSSLCRLSLISLAVKSENRITFKIKSIISHTKTAANGDIVPQCQIHAVAVLRECIATGVRLIDCKPFGYSVCVWGEEAGFQ
jgi:hypothetical protein